jgi:hypothetical protein
MSDKPTHPNPAFSIPVGEPVDGVTRLVQVETHGDDDIEVSFVHHDVDASSLFAAMRLSGNEALRLVAALTEAAIPDAPPGEGLTPSEARNLAHLLVQAADSPSKTRRLAQELLESAEGTEEAES